MARLPQPGGDNGNWGTILNDYLLQSHTSTGTLKDNAVGTGQLQSNSITIAKVDSAIQYSLTKADNSLSATTANSDYLKKQDASSTYVEGKSVDVGDSMVIKIGDPTHLVTPQDTTPSDNSSAITLIGGGLTGGQNVIQPGNINLRGIFGGYDNVIGPCLASNIFGSHHSSITAPTDHATIIGGSLHAIETAGSYAGIIAGTNHRARAQGAVCIGGANHVASGTAAVTIGGETNTSSGARAVIIGGANNTSTGNDSGILGGANNNLRAKSTSTLGGELHTIGTTGQTWGDYTGAVGGYSNSMGTTATARYSATLAGRSLSVQHEYAVASGYQAVTRMAGSHVIGAQRFAADGDAQISTVPLKATITSASPTALSAIGGALPTLPVDSAWSFSTIITVRDTASDDAAGFEVKGLVQRSAAGTMSVVGSPAITTLGASSGATAWAASVAVGGSTLQIRVAGDAGKTLYAVANLRTAEVIA